MIILKTLQKTIIITVSNSNIDNAYAELSKHFNAEKAKIQNIFENNMLPIDLQNTNKNKGIQSKSILKS